MDKNNIGYNKTTCLSTPGARSPETVRQSHPRHLCFFQMTASVAMYGEVHKKHTFSPRFTSLLPPNNMAQKQIKLHSKMGTQFPLEEVAKLLQRKNLKERKFHSALGARTEVCPTFRSLGLPPGRAGPKPPPLTPFLSPEGLQWTREPKQMPVLCGESPREALGCPRALSPFFPDFCVLCRLTFFSLQLSELSW